MSSSFAKIISIPCLKDNFSYLHTFKDNNFCLIIDAPELLPIINEIKKRSLKPLALLITHEHWDHINSAEEIKNSFPNIKVFAHPNLSHEHSFISCPLNDGQEINEEFYNFKSIHTPSHSESDICFYFKENDPVLYTGDSFFVGGAGKLFWGQGIDLLNAAKKIRALPKKTRIFCGHEYTKSNLEFALTLEPNNISIQKALSAAQKNTDKTAHIASTIADELSFNPYFRWGAEELVETIQKQFKNSKNPEDIIGSIREIKDNWP